MIYVFLGPAGSGKDTQADLLAKILNIPVIGTGDLFRKEIAEKTKLGEEAKKYMDDGIIVPDEFVVKVLKNEIKKPEYSNGFILTGYPRKVTQIAPLDKMLKELNMELTKVVHFELDEEESVKRMQTQAKENPGKRSDTDLESMKNRYRTMYSETIGAIVEEYGKRGEIIHVDARPSKKDIHQVVIKKLNIN
ncbi:MAG TPA: adenylate kinase [bacterium]|nr:adenylate kinase [bacterium]